MHLRLSVCVFTGGLWIVGQQSKDLIIQFWLSRVFHINASSGLFNPKSNPNPGIINTLLVYKCICDGLHCYLLLYLFVDLLHRNDKPDVQGYT